MPQKRKTHLQQPLLLCCQYRKCYKYYPKEHINCLATKHAVSANCTFSITNIHGDYHKEEKDSDECDDIEINDCANDEDKSLNTINQIQDNVFDSNVNEDDVSKEEEANPFALVDNFLIYNDQDLSTNHNDCPDEGFMTTIAGDIARGIGNYEPMRQVSGHVLLNHAVICFNKFGKPLSGTQSQKHFVQRVA